MYILNRRIYASNDFFIKMWIFSAVVIVIVAAVLLWNDRFRESIETQSVRFSPFGIEVNNREVSNFTGSRGFFNKMNKLGLPASVRKTELATLFETTGNAENAFLAESKEVFAQTPVLWLYAEGLTKEDRDRSVQTFGKSFFDKNRYCFSIVDENGFAIQLDPESFHVLWARDGGAICALPLFVLPEYTRELGFVFRIEERQADGGWKLAGEIVLPEFDYTPWFPPQIQIVLPDGETPPEDDINPKEVVIDSLFLPQNCRFYSSPLWDRSDFGQLRVLLRANDSGKVPAAAWSLDNFSLRAPNTTGDGQFFPMTRTDPFHRNVRFLEGELFEEEIEGALCVPVAKALFPAYGEGDAFQPWEVELRFVRNIFFRDDFHAFPAKRVAKSSAVIPETLKARESSAKVRVFRDHEYMRLLNNDVPAVVLEIEQSDPEFFWAPYRVKTDTGEELFPESIVNVSPNIRQYWFLPRKKELTKVEVIYTVTPYFYASGLVTPIVEE